MNDRMILPRVSEDETTFAVVEYAGVDRLDLKRSVQPPCSGSHVPQHVVGQPALDI